MDISQFGGDVRDVIEQKFTSQGKLFTEKDELELTRVFAKKTVIEFNTGDVRKIHEVLTHNNLIYDFMGADSHRTKTLDLKLKKVGAKTFDLYLMYLQTKNSMYMTRAQRSLIND